MSKILTGTVASDSVDKTIIVSVLSRKTHPIYKKQYSSSKRFAVHDPKNEAKIGDKVTITEMRPMSARKRHQLLEVVERAAIRHEEKEAIL